MCSLYVGEEEEKKGVGGGEGNLWDESRWHEVLFGRVYFYSVNGWASR